MLRCGRNRGSIRGSPFLGTLEVRLQHADLMILGGLERRRVAAGDGSGAVVEPADAARTRCQPAGAPRGVVGARLCASGGRRRGVADTRAEKDGGAPTTPSRWLTRLSMLVDGAGFGERLENATVASEFARRARSSALDATEGDRAAGAEAAGGGAAARISP